MLGDKLSSTRMSLQTRGSCGIGLGRSKNHAIRDSNLADVPQYTLNANVQLSENNKKMLQAFKQNSGFYNISPKKQRNSPENKPLFQNNASNNINNNNEQKGVQCKRIYLFGHKDGNYQQKQQEKENIYCSKTDKIDIQYLQRSIPNELRNQGSQRNTLKIDNDKQLFLKQLFQTLGLIRQTENKFAFSEVLQLSYTKFIQMKSSGRWALIAKYFKGTEEQQLHNNFSSRSIMKKRSLLQTQNTIGEKKKVKLVQPETASQLIRTKYKLAEDLEGHLSKLTKGYAFQKFCYKSQKVQEISVYLSYDLKCLAWKVKGKQLVQVQDMLNYDGITDGVRSKNYQKYLFKNFPIDEQLAFSIILKNRTLDLQAKNLQQKMAFVEGMKFARSCL